MKQYTPRSRPVIIRDFLKAAKGGANITKIVYDTNTNFEMAGRYLTDLVKEGMITFDGQKWKTTEKGLQYVCHMLQMQVLFPILR